jgi:hypothetical protein
MTGKTPPFFPPVPKWRPSIVMPLDRIVERIRYYTNESKDFVIFEYGTCVLLEDNLSDSQAEQFAKGVLSCIFLAHPDMQPLEMDDANIVVSYNHPALNVVLSDVVQENWAEINGRTRDTFAGHEVLVPRRGLDRFGDLIKKALFGRCYMFMDAQTPKATYIHRR